MATPTPRQHVPTPRQYPPRPPAGPPEVVSPIWLFKAVAITIAAALVCAYLTLCLLVYQGQWQLVLHPAVSTAPLTLSGATPIHFGAAETGQPALTGLWLPAAIASDRTILLLPDGSASLAANAATLNQLHQLPLNILAFDYRGFGASVRTPHPTQQSMTADSESALDYLINTRHIRPQTIVPYGAGLGASIAATLAAHHPELPAVILESAVPDVLAEAKSDPRASVVPLRLFFHERFDLAPTLLTLTTPKLLLNTGPSSVTPHGHSDTLYRQAHAPSRTTHLTSPSDPQYTAAVSRFLDEYLP